MGTGSAPGLEVNGCGCVNLYHMAASLKWSVAPKRNCIDCRLPQLGRSAERAYRLNVSSPADENSDQHIPFHAYPSRRPIDLGVHRLNLVNQVRAGFALGDLLALLALDRLRYPSANFPQVCLRIGNGALAIHGTVFRPPRKNGAKGDDLLVQCRLGCSAGRGELDSLMDYRPTPERPERFIYRIVNARLRSQHVLAKVRKRTLDGNAFGPRATSRLKRRILLDCGDLSPKEQKRLHVFLGCGHHM